MPPVNPAVLAEILAAHPLEDAVREVVVVRLLEREQLDQRRTGLLDHLAVVPGAVGPSDQARRRVRSDQTNSGAPGTNSWSGAMPSPMFQPGRAPP